MFGYTITPGGYQVYGSIEGFVKYRITGTQQFNNKTFFLTQRDIIIIQGSFATCQIGIMNGPLRIDSISGIVYVNAQCNANSTTPYDSLKSQLHDTSNLCALGFDTKNICIDTSIYNFFGNSYPTKSFDNPGFESDRSRSYVKNIGIVSYHSGQSNGACSGNLIGCVIDGVLHGDTSMIVGVNQISAIIPDNFSLSQNYPNPFNPNTNIKFQIANSSNAKLIVYDALGKEVETLVDKKLEPGEYEANFDGTNRSSGVYYYKLEAGDYIETKKMVLIK